MIRAIGYDMWRIKNMCTHLLHLKAVGKIAAKSGIVFSKIIRIYN